MGSPERPVDNPTPPGPLVLRERTRWGIRLVLNRPDTLNALSAALVDELVAAVAEAGADAQIRVVVLAGAGRAFCAGYDLAEEVAHPPVGPAGRRATLARDAEATLAVWRCPKPVIAEVHGDCLAGGLELAMACDLVVAAAGARFGAPGILNGSAPVTLLMPYLVGQKKTRELLLTGELIGAPEAHRLGLVNRVVPADQLDGEVGALADRLARTPPELMALTKGMLNRAMEAAGFLTAVEAGIDLGAVIHAADTPEQLEWDRLVREHGLEKALAWRAARDAERVGRIG